MPKFFTEKGEMFETENIICTNFGGFGNYNVWTKVPKSGMFGDGDVGPIYSLSESDKEKLLALLGNPKEPFRSVADAMREEAETIVQNVTLNKEGELEVPPGNSVNVQGFHNELGKPAVGEPQSDAPIAGENTDTEETVVEGLAPVITEGE